MGLVVQLHVTIITDTITIAKTAGLMVTKHEN